MGPVAHPFAAVASPTVVVAAGPVQLHPAPAQEMLHGAVAGAAAARVGVVMVAAAAALAACAPDAPRADAPGPEAPPPAVVAVVAVRSSEDEVTRALESGVAVEVGHWLSHASDVAVREGNQGAAHVVRLALEPSPTGWVARWEVAAPGGASAPDSTAVRPEQMARLPRAVALQVFADVSADAVARDALEAALDPSPVDAYMAFLRILGTGEGDAPGGPSAGVALPTGEEKARRLLARTVALDTVVARLSDAPAAELELGSAYLELAGLSPGDAPYYDLAGRHLSRALELDPGLPSAREKLASYNTKLGRSEEALALLDEGIARHASYAGFHDARGYLLRYAGWMRESIASYVRAQELDPRPGSLVSTQDQITKSLIYLGDYAEALASHRRVDSLLADLGRPATEKEHFYEGVIHLYADDGDAAVVAFRDGRAVDPTTVWSTFGEGYEGIALGDTARVRDVLAQLEALDVVDGERHYRLVHLAAFLGEPARALEHLGYSIAAGFFASPYFETDPLTESLRADPAFGPLLATAAARHDGFLTRAPSGDHDDPK